MKNSLRYDFFASFVLPQHIPTAKTHETGKKLLSCCLCAVKKCSKCAKTSGVDLSLAVGPACWDHACGPKQSATFLPHSPNPSLSNNHRPRLIFPSTVVAREPHPNKIPLPLSVPSNFRDMTQAGKCLQHAFCGIFRFSHISQIISVDGRTEFSSGRRGRGKCAITRLWRATMMATSLMRMRYSHCFIAMARPKRMD